MCSADAGGIGAQWGGLGGGSLRTRGRASKEWATEDKGE